LGWFIRFALRAVMPPAGRFKGVGDTALKPYLAQLRRDAPPLFRIGIVATSFVFIWSPLVTIFLPLPAFFLPKALLEKHAQRAAKHPFYLLRQSTFMVKMVAGLCWAQDADVRREFGLPALPPDPTTWREGQ
jgi:hypothetical protein